METFKKLNYLLNKKTKLRLIGIFILTIIGSFAELLGIAIVLPIVELAMNTENWKGNKWASLVIKITGVKTKESILLWLIGTTLVIYIIKNMYLAFMNYRLYRFAADVKREQSINLLVSYLKQPYSFFLTHNTADLIRSVSTDTSQLYEVTINCLMVISNGLTSLEIILYLAITNFWMTITIALLLGLCGLCIVLGLQKKFRKNGRENQKLSAYLIKNLQQSFEGIKEIKLLNNEKYFVKEYDTNYKKQADIGVINSFLNQVPKYLIEFVCIGGILGFLAINVIYNPNYVTLMPQLSVFCVAAYKLLPSVNAISGYTGTIIYHRASIDLVYNDVKAASQFSESYDNNIASKEEFGFNRNIEIKNIVFSYEDSDRNVLDNTNFVINKGQSVAFVGPSGGGKTTTADIILSLLKPKEGQVLVDGKDIISNIWGWRHKLGYIPQFIYLTDDTIRNNIAFGVDEDKIDDDEVWRALKEAQLYDFIKSLPKGLDTMVGERGARISGGQRQRIGIARALYRNPEVLVFDEATSALDNETEREVMEAVNSLQGTKTMIMIAHRLTTVEKCDVIYKIENGKAIGISKEELYQ